jgi:hypothetical protein
MEYGRAASRSSRARAGPWRHRLDDGSAGRAAERRPAGHARPRRARRQNLQAPAGAQVIDGAGRHVTPGLIDAHLHSGASGGINETGSAIVPEVRLGDVLTIDNIWMYRQLAGGLTTAHVMHGSANPIGGQNQHVKLRWGALPSSSSSRARRAP